MTAAKVPRVPIFLVRVAGRTYDVHADARIAHAVAGDLRARGVTASVEERTAPLFSQRENASRNRGPRRQE